MTCWGPHRNQVVGRILLGQTEDPADVVVVKGTDRYGAQVEGCGLQQQVLGGVAGFQVDVAGGPLTVLDRRALVDGANHKHGRRFAQGVLLQPNLPDRRAQVLGQQRLQLVALGPVVVQTVRTDQVKF